MSRPQETLTPESKTMEIFKTTAVIDDDSFILWGASQTEAAKHRKTFKKDMPEAAITTTTVNIPTAKGPLVAWLNEHVLS